MSPQLAIATLKAMESTFIIHFIVFISQYFYFQHTSISNLTIPQIWLQNLDLLSFRFNQPFNNYNISSMNHKDGNIVSYQMLFTKPKTSNVFDQQCCKVANTIHLNQLHVLCKKSPLTPCFLTPPNLPFA